MYTKGDEVRAPGHLEPVELLLRKQDPSKLLRFFQNLSEGFAAACADSSRTFPADRADRPAVYARGMMRRMLMDVAFRKAARDAGLVASTGFNDPPSWSFPVIRVGAFSLTLGIVDRQNASAPRRLRCRGEYISALARRNRPLKPQKSLFHERTERVPDVIPSGSLGALVVLEPSLHTPDTPSFIGFWVPSPSLKRSYFRCSVETLIRQLREIVDAGKIPKRVMPERKRPSLKAKRPKRS